MAEHLPLILSYLAAVGFGGIVAAVVNHRFASGRESRAKKDDFRGFLGRWIAEIEQITPTDIRGIADAYYKDMIHFKGYAAKLDRDFYRKKKFLALCNDVTAWGAEGVRENIYINQRDEITAKIRAVIEFV